MNRGFSFQENYLASLAEVLQGSERIGLGFFLAKRIVATCSHVVRDAGADLRVRLPGGTRDARVVFEDPERDVAFLQLDVPVQGYIVRPLELDEESPQGKSVQLVGWSTQEGTPLERGTPLLQSTRVEGVAGVDLTGSGARGDLYQLGGDVRPGYSGGPVVVEGSGQVCGMVVARERSAGLGLIVPGAVLSDCYRRLVAQTGAEQEPPAAVRARASNPATIPPAPGGRYRLEDHVDRPRIDDEVLDLFERAEPIVLCAPTMSGKTWWLNHLLPRLEQRMGPRGAVVAPLSAVFGASTPMKALLLSLIDALVRGIRGDAKTARASWDDDLDPTRNAENCLQDHFFAASDKSVLLVLDLQDEFWDNPDQSQFLLMLRSWAQQPGWERLRVLVAYSTTPSVWSSNPADSPFAVLPVLIEDWDPHEVDRAVRAYGFDAPVSAIERLMTHTGGHPYLVRMALHNARTRQCDLSAYVDGLQGDLGPMRQVVDKMFRRCRIDQCPELRLALSTVATGKGAIEPASYRRLADAGLVVGTAVAPKLRFPVVQRVLRGE